ncbi:TPA_asm: G [Mango betacytorhabdovirus 1]|nr:TPA_asm: G [Mango betacytorhabdovirus 1]
MYFRLLILFLYCSISFSHASPKDYRSLEPHLGRRVPSIKPQNNSPESITRIPRKPKFDDIVSLHPLARCLTSYIDKSVAERECISKCPVQRKDNEFKSLRIYDYRQQTHEKLFSMCNTYEYTSVYTETWTFSKIKTPPTTEKVLTNLSDCERLFNKICNGVPCHALGYEANHDYFSWASDNKVTERASVLSVGSGLSYWLESIGHWAFSFPGHDQSVVDSEGKYYDKTNDVYVLWKPSNIKDFPGCPLKTSHDHVCEVIGDGEYWCPALRVYLKSTGDIVKMKECADRVIHRDKSYFFEILPDHPVDISADSSFIYDMDPKRQLNDLVHLINSVFLTRDTKTCIQECTSILNSRPIGSLIMAGYQYWSEAGNGSLSLCIPEFNCQIYTPIIFCKDPLMIKVKCSSGIVWFNMDTMRTSAWSHCLTVQEQNEKSIIVPIKGGTLLINVSGSYLMKHSMDNYIQHPHPLTNPHITGEKVDYHTRDHHESVISSSESYGKRSEKISGINSFLAWISYPVVMLRTWLSEIEHSIKAAIILVLLTSIILLGSVTWYKERPSIKTSTQVKRQQEIDQASIHLI